MAKADDNKRNRVPENDPSKAMDSKREVEQSPDPKTDQDFPGYPHYPSKEDIMDKRTDSHRVDMDVENLPNSRNLSGVSQRFNGNSGTNSERGMPPTGRRNDNEDPDPASEGRDTDALRSSGSRASEIGAPQDVDDDDLGMRPGTDADVSPDEVRALASMNTGSTDEDNLRRASLDDRDFDGDPLNEESFGPMQTSAGLDIPDEVDETETESLGQGDEENKYYSLGGDRHEPNEEDPYSGPGRES
ncbi:hypothetical protein [Flaviaesturariibacter aridisoli]|uniref:Uncharacterized protein n=1 Tax=Flaviaesturariibacter aridisoli TaxID=2545761 RepID=A0A4R4E991_9BACT|nr:hypothetical protein [Flaviaesturariibacter aridisoli]TCZ74398.1 hypothetical protein E0486_01880 [Flaviaesturariibacter aridisoli]